MKLAMQDIPPLQVLFMRGVAAFILCLPLLWLSGRGRALMRAFNGFVLVRGLFEAIGVICFVIALANMAIADITAIYQISPLLVAGGVSLIWGERIGPLRSILICLGIAGALLVAQPGATTASPYAVLGFATALGAAARDIISRQVPRDIPVLAVTFSIIVIVMLAAGTGSLIAEDWVVPHGRHYALSLAAGAFLIAAHYTVFLAYRYAEARTLAPFYYTAMIWAVASGVVIFGDLPNALALAGMAVIAVSGIVVVVIDGRQSRAAARQF